MDFIQKLMSGFRLDLSPVKEPLGFIRLLEWLFTIFAFATTGGYVGSSSMTTNCPNATSNTDIVANFGYPFRLPSRPYEMSFCNGTKVNMYLTGDFSSSAEFFVCVGVFAFLYCTFTLILYLGYQHVYRETTRGPIIDLILTGIFAFMWLVSSSAWGKGLTDVKHATSPQTLSELCNPHCLIKEYPPMGRLNASVIFGFLNLILWAGNCWFIYKETPFHKPAHPPPNPEDPGSSS
uniref:Synaptophysin-like 2a n=1 Tax=Astyanax mexicanus TaxID=7994 RepID=A0A3B1K7Q6_ASTMX